MVVETRLEVVLVDRRDQLLDLAVRRQQDRGGGHFIEVAHLEADDAVLNVIDDADPVATTELGCAFQQRDEPELLAVERDGQPDSKPTRTYSGSSGASSGRVTS